MSAIVINTVGSRWTRLIAPVKCWYWRYLARAACTDIAYWQDQLDDIHNVPGMTDDQRDDFAMTLCLSIDRAEQYITGLQRRINALENHQ